MDERKRRWKEIDNLYAIGMILVVLGHSHSSDWSSFSETFLKPLIEFIYVFHMPLFFFIAGFLFMNSTSWERLGFGCWIAQKAQRLLTPYVVLSAFALIPKYYVENHSLGGFTFGYLAKVVFIPRMGVWGHFWFLPVLFLLYMILGTSRGLLNGNSVNSVFFIMTLISVVLYFEPYSTQWFGFSDFKEAAVFFTVGMIMRYYGGLPKEDASAVFRILWIVCGFVLSLVLIHWFNGNKLIVLSVALIMISVCWQVAVLIGDNSICRWVSNHNFTIYIYSWIFQAVVMVIISRLGVLWYLITLTMFVTGIAAPVCSIFVYKKLKVLHNKFFDLLLGIK